MICIEQVSYTYPQSEKPTLKNISLNIEEGEFLAIVGKNGSGKTTLAKLLNGLILPDSGKVIVDNLDTKDRVNHVKIRQKVGLLLPSPDNQIIFNIVEEDIAFGPENLGLSSNEIRYRVDTALKLVSMEEFAKHPPYLLSGGQKQKVALAGLLAMKPDYLVLDEPTSMLDSKSKANVIKTLLDIKRSTSVTIVMITHNLNEIIRADRVLLLDDGEIKAITTPSQLYKHTEELESYGIEPLEITYLIDLLNKQGKLNLAEGLLTVDDLVYELCQLK